MPGKGKPFTKGDERINRNGAPKQPWTWGQLIKEAMEEIEEETGLEYKKVAVNKLREKVTQLGDVQAFNALADRQEGKPKQALEHSGEVDTTITVVSNIPDGSTS